MRDAPFAADLAQSDRQPALERGVGRAAPHHHHRERHVIAGRDRDLLDIEGVGRAVTAVEQVPRLPVRVQSARLQRRRNVEHHDILIVMGENARIVLSADRGRPGVDE
ncbi:hypothetical protein NS44R_15050 [Mammaliicoccus sciuri]|nr:hypothetical protein NS44R_15050 [Mammaliicoccus sciuri]